jgi:quercetin dioxygenase-like cupin family protein
VKTWTRLGLPHWVSIGLAGALIIAVAPTVLATPPEGMTPTILAAVNLTDPAQLKLKQATGFGTPRDVADVVTGKFELGPGGTFGWHSHSGPVVVSVAEGTLTVVMAEGCMEHHYSAGQGFIESGRDVHTAFNAGTTKVVIYATFLLPDGAAPRIDQPPAAC